MPGLPQVNDHHNHHRVSNGSIQEPSSQALSSSYGGSVASNGFWSKNGEDVNYYQLQKFWSELSPQARQMLLRIDKQTLFEAARKNMYCSRCNGLLLEGFLQIVMHGKSVQLEGEGELYLCDKQEAFKNHNGSDVCAMNGCEDAVQDPSVHPWAGLTTARDGTLTLLDCYVYSKSLKVLRNVFDSARARERERELLYPDACGGGGRGWMSQAISGYGRGHGARETCALHTARLSVDTLVDFWSALGEETRQSLLRMKEEDFIERLIYRFDSKRFCRDCRRNVIREFKELKELKRTRRETRCNSWFCAADTAFQYEVSHDTILADWNQTFIDTSGIYHHFEWAVGTGEGQSDILGFENVGLSGKVKANGLELGGLNACYITLRAWKMDGRRNEVSVKAHALKGQQCVHCRLIVGDGFVTITRGENIRHFFEHAEEAEEEEDDDSIDKDGNEMDGECSRPQKHAKSPELAREFLLDAATVIFKEQIEKAFREGTARQNAHSIFVCLALKLLEERVLVAFKEIITLEKQMKLLEEVEKEKREEEERKERRRTKEREKKLRRKERLREKEKDREKRSCESNQNPLVSDLLKEQSPLCAEQEPSVVSNGDSVCETLEAVLLLPVSPDDHDEQISNGYVTSDMQNHLEHNLHGEHDAKDVVCPVTDDYSKHSSRKIKHRKGYVLDSISTWSDKQRMVNLSENGATANKLVAKYQSCNTLRSINGLNKQSRSCAAKSNVRNGNLKFGEKFYCFNGRMKDIYDLNACSCSQHNNNRGKLEPHCSMTRTARDAKSVAMLESVSEISKPHYRGNKYIQVESTRENSGRPKGKISLGQSSSSRGLPHTKKVWEPMESQKKHLQSNSDSEVTLVASTFKVSTSHSDKHLVSSDSVSSEIAAGNSVNSSYEDTDLKEPGNLSCEVDKKYQNGFDLASKSPLYSKETAEEEVESSVASSSSNGPLDLSMTSTSISDNCSSCQSEGDSLGSSLNFQNPESSSVSDSEEGNQPFEGNEVSFCSQNAISECHEVGREKKQYIGGEFLRRITPDSTENNSLENIPRKNVQNDDNGKTNGVIGLQNLGARSPMVNQGMHFPMLQAPSMGYYHQSPVSWPAAPSNGLISFPHPNHYVFASHLGYSYNGDSRFMQYGAVNHLTSHLYNPGHVPIFRPVSQINGINSKEHPGVFSKGEMKEASHGANIPKVIPTGDHPMEAPSGGENFQNGHASKSDVEDTGFSLFHFGGPLGLSSGDNLNPQVPEGNVADVSFKFSSDHGDDDHVCNNKKDVIEEYNLFAASNGIRFSIF